MWVEKDCLIVNFSPIRLHRVFLALSEFFSCFPDEVFFGGQNDTALL